jgi:hypothetical protein
MRAPSPRRLLVTLKRFLPNLYTNPRMGHFCQPVACVPRSAFARWARCARHRSVLWSTARGFRTGLPPEPGIAEPMDASLSGVSAHPLHSIMATGDPDTPLNVACHAGYKGDERPIRFRLGDTEHFIEEILDQWYGPDDAYFKVKVGGGGVYTLRRSLALASQESEWVLEGFRR